MKDNSLEQQYDIIIHEQIRKRIDNYNEIVEKYNPWKNEKM